MNKDDHSSLSLVDRFNLYLSTPAIDREMLKVRRPIISIENLPDSVYANAAQFAKETALKSVPAAGIKTKKDIGTATRRTKKEDEKAERKH
jgi:hypothetical protein